MWRSWSRRAGSRSPDLPNLGHREGGAHVEAGEGGMSHCRSLQVQCRETESPRSCGADTSADPYRNKNVIDTVLLESGCSGGKQ